MSLFASMRQRSAPSRRAAAFFCYRSPRLTPYRAAPREAPAPASPHILAPPAEGPPQGLLAAPESPNGLSPPAARARGGGAGGEGGAPPPNRGLDASLGAAGIGAMALGATIVSSGRPRMREKKPPPPSAISTSAAGLGECENPSAGCAGNSTERARYKTIAKTSYGGGARRVSEGGSGCPGHANARGRLLPRIASRKRACTCPRGFASILSQPWSPVGVGLRVSSSACSTQSKRAISLSTTANAPASEKSTRKV